MAVTGYEFGYTDASGLPTSFVLGGITDDVAKGIRQGLRNVPSITNVTAERIVSTRENVT